jgi:alkylation response protein AidB-like acyl-CoA dehydrogenase
MSKAKGINCLIVEKGMPGFVVGAKEDKLGIRGSDTHADVPGREGAQGQPHR